MNEKMAAGGVVAAGAAFGLTLAEVGEIVRIIAGLAATVSAIAAAVYYWKKSKKL
jgi:hypothetical protein